MNTQEKSKVIAGMDNIQVDRIITEARGKCHHEWQSHGYRYNDTCKKCSRDRGNSPPYNNLSPTTSWADYGEAIEWAKKEEWWEDFIQYFLIRKFGSNIYDFSKSIINCMTDPEKGSHALAEFIESEGK